MPPLNDHVEALDSLFVELVTPDGATPPVNPCPSCGKESKEHHPETREDGTSLARRICSAADCRSVFYA